MANKKENKSSLWDLNNVELGTSSKRRRSKSSSRSEASSSRSQEVFIPGFEIIEEKDDFDNDVEETADIPIENTSDEYMLSLHENWVQEYYSKFLSPKKSKETEKNALVPEEVETHAFAPEILNDQDLVAKAERMYNIKIKDVKVKVKKLKTDDDLVRDAEQLSGVQIKDLIVYVKKLKTDDDLVSDAEQLSGVQIKDSIVYVKKLKTDDDLVREAEKFYGVEIKDLIISTRRCEEEKDGEEDYDEEDYTVVNVESMAFSLFRGNSTSKSMK